MWHKTSGEVDYDGLYYVDKDGNKSYFLLFFEDARRYSNNNIWSVHYKNEHIYLPITSSSRRSDPGTTEKPVSTADSTRDTSPTNGRSSTQTEETSAGPSQRRPTLRRRRRGGEGESTESKRRKLTARQSAVPSPEQVGKSHRSIGRANLNRLERLQAEARDPAIVLLRGPANKLKCWRYRWKPKLGSPGFSTVFKWVTQEETHDSRMLLTFNSNGDREYFLKHTQFPKGFSWALGSLDAL